MDFWNSLGPDRKVEFEAEALKCAEANKNNWYEDAQRSSRCTAKAFHTAILRDHFERAKLKS